MARKGRSSHETANDTLVTTAETVVATVGGIDLPRPGVAVTVRGTAQLTTGTGTTAVTPRIRRGTAITDPLVGEANAVTIGAAAGGTEEFSLEVVDSPGELAGGSYVLTLQQTAATGNGTALQASLDAEWDA